MTTPLAETLEQRYLERLSALEQRVFDERARAEKAERERDVAIRDLCRWREAIQRLTPGGSEYMDPEAVKAFAAELKRSTFEANKNAALAKRDLAAAREALRKVRRLSQMSANIMRDTRRTGNWEGSERVAKQFDSLAALSTTEPSNG